ncbi:MAG: alpha/beta hydrolase [Hyphomicrobiales bacterium]|nr:alpha/beta hydrolase [Hyphomicrobiales bacterium]
MRRFVRGAGVALFVGVGAATAQAMPSFPLDFQEKTIEIADGVAIHTRIGGRGPVAILLHGFTQTGDMWAPLAADLARDHTVIVPDLRGQGRSSRPASGYDKKTMAADIRAVTAKLGYDGPAAVVGHDIGMMVAYAYAAQYPDKVSRLALLEAPLPGIQPWDDILKNPRVWHFSFHGPYAEKLVAGRERIYLDRFWDEFAAQPTKITDDMRRHYTSVYAKPGAMRAGFAQFAAFPEDASDNQKFSTRKLTMPVLAVGGEKSFGPGVELIATSVAENVRSAVVPGVGHWLMEEAPEETTKIVRQFLASTR